MFKFNDGKGSIICDECRTLIQVNVEPTEENKQPYCCSRCKAAQEVKRLLKKIKAGWTMHIWRSTTPSNYWMESPKRRKEIQLDVVTFARLRKYVEPIESIGRVFAPSFLFSSQNGMSEHEVFAYKGD
jgi:hypothetical protein